MGEKGRGGRLVASSEWDNAIPRIRVCSCRTPVHQLPQPTKGLKKTDRRTYRRQLTLAVNLTKHLLARPPLTFQHQSLRTWLPKVATHPPLSQSLLPSRVTTYCFTRRCLAWLATRNLAVGRTMPIGVPDLQNFLARRRRSLKGVGCETYILDAGFSARIYLT